MSSPDLQTPTSSLSDFALKLDDLYQGSVPENTRIQSAGCQLPFHLRDQVAGLAALLPQYHVVVSVSALETHVEISRG